MESNANLYDIPYKTYSDITTEEITLTSLERKIFSFFLSHNPSNSIFRVAGGWVRDKLLHRPSEDIDITIDNITGKEYTDLLMKDNTEISVIHNSNAKSSHLQTSTIVLFDKQIDIVNLRKEIYKKNSRVPEVSMGTVEEDVYRRDITINCLYYNINTGKIEDFTKKGIEDLKNGLIRMPKKPFDSFSEDPLRMLRVIRFTTRFCFKIDKEIEECISDSNLIENFVTVLSNERIEKEMTAMMEGENAHCSVYLLYKFNLLKHVMKFSYEEKEKANEEKDYVQSVNMILMKNKIKNMFDVSEIENKIINYAAITATFRKYTTKKKKEIITGSKIILTQVLKLPNSEITEILFLISQIDKIKNSISLHGEYQRLDIAMLLRGIKRKYLNTIFLLCICDEYTSNKSSIISSINEIELSKIQSKYQTLLTFIHTEKLESISELKPIIDGKTLKTTLDIKEGKTLGLLLDELIKYQIMNASVTKESAIEYLRTKINKK